MNGRRWVFAVMVDARTAGFPGAQPGVETPGAEVVAEVLADAMTTRQADGFQRTLANRLGRPIGSYITSARSNPTLVHHGRAKAAKFHLVSQAGAAVADVYHSSGEVARAIAQTVADALGIRVHVLRNIMSGAGSIHTRMARVSPARRNPGKRQNAAALVRELKRIANLYHNSKITHRQLGDFNRRVWDQAEMLGVKDQVTVAISKWRPNPSRSRRARYSRSARRAAPRGVPGAGSRRTRRSIAGGRAAKAHHHMLGTLERGRFRRTANPKGPPIGAHRVGSRSRGETAVQFYYTGDRMYPSAWYIQFARQGGLAPARSATYKYGSRAAVDAFADVFLSGGSVPEAASAARRADAMHARNPRREPSRVRVGGTRVTAPSSPEQRIAAIREIVERKQYAKVDGVMVDLFSASAIIQVYDALNEVNRAKFASFPVQMMADIAFKIANRKNPRVLPAEYRAGWRRAWAACLSGRARRTPNRRGRNPRAFEMGEHVTVPYTGRSSYFGRPVKRTRERATVEWVNTDGTVLVTVRRGRSAESHTFEPHLVRRRPRKGGAAVKERGQAVKRRLELVSIRKRHREAIAAVDKAIQARDCAEAKAKAIQPTSGERGTPEYNRLRAQIRRLTAEIDAQGSIAHELERQDPAWRDPWALATTTNPRDPVLGEIWTTSRGGRCKIMALTAGRVQVLHMETGNREWIDRADFMASYHPSGRRNPIPRSIDRRSVRTVGRGRKRILVGCPTGRYRPRARGRKCSSAMRKVNPRGSERHRALATFRRWHEFDAHKVTMVPGPPRTIPKTVVRLGEVRAIVYDSDKYAGGPDNPKGEVITYEHETKRPRPLLVTDPAGRHVHIIGGGMKVTADGLVN